MQLMSEMGDPKEDILNLIGNLNRALVALTARTHEIDNRYIARLRNSVEELSHVLKQPRFLEELRGPDCERALASVRESILMQNLTLREGLINQEAFNELFRESFKIYSILKAQEIQSTGN